MTPDVAIVVSPRPWAEQLHRFVADHGGARVRARVLDGREAIDEGYDVLVVDDLTSFLTPRLVDEVHRRGRRILGVHDPVEPAGRERLRDLGVDEVVAATESPERVVQLLDALVLAGAADLDRELVVLARDPGPAASGPAPSPGHPVIAVGGVAGGPGVTEVALETAMALVRAGRRSVLVDLDEVAPSLAQRLGLDLHPNLRTAVDVVQHRSGVLDDVVREVAGLEVVVGVPSGRDAVDLRPGEVVDTIDELATRGTVVVDVGHRLESLGGHGTTGRYDRARALVSRADAVVVACAPSPVGVARTLDWVADVRALSSAPLHVVVNRAPSSGFRQGEVQHELRRSCEPASLLFLPDDRRVAAAAWEGAVVARGPFRKAVARWIDALATVGAPA